MLCQRAYLSKQLDENTLLPPPPPHRPRHPPLASSSHPTPLHPTPPHPPPLYPQCPPTPPPFRPTLLWCAQPSHHSKTSDESTQMCSLPNRHPILPPHSTLLNPTQPSPPSYPPPPRNRPPCPPPSPPATIVCYDSLRTTLSSRMRTPRYAAGAPCFR